jgi:ATP-dependent exoDNAse (exonuclease V) beta subunit
MPDAPRRNPPPDQAQRVSALDPQRSILVRAPAGSGKTDLLTRRFLRLLGEVDDPGQVVAITFTIPAAAEMRNRILSELEKAALASTLDSGTDPLSMGILARRALVRSQTLGWDLLNLPAQLRISTIDSFCRDLALQQPLLSGLGGGLDISKQPAELYRRAARRTLQQIGHADTALSTAIETMLDWRDNNWREIEDLTVEMLKNRDRWMQDFVLEREPAWDLLRARLEAPFLRADGETTPIRYSDAEWQIVCACFNLLRRAAAELRVVFAESATADFTEVAQIALSVLKGEDGFPTDTAQAVADGIHHLLVDEFQDTSRRQHELLRRLIAAWSDREGRTCFVVGDPMQSIYGFREADAELFPRVEKHGLEIPGDLAFPFDGVQLTANFRSEPSLVASVNEAFTEVFAASSGTAFAASQPARGDATQPGPHLVEEPIPRLQFHVEFIPGAAGSSGPDRKKQIATEREAAQQEQIDKIVEIVRTRLPQIEAARAANENNQSGGERKKFRIAVLGRARKSLEPIAAALRDAGIHFRAIELEKLHDRPEIIDALALARAFLNPYDRVSWLGVLRAPWCGLSLGDLHLLVSADSLELLARSVSELLSERSHLLSAEGREAVDRLTGAIAFAERLRSGQPTAALGTGLEQVWLRLGGAQCVDAEARANLDLLWKSLDALPQGEPDLLGPALNAALENLTALPDPAVESDFGVQLMTIHKAKGLEFEVVIVPDLQKGAPRGKHEMLSWLERGLPLEIAANEGDNTGEVTEFLVAPFSPKGSDRSEAKKWVDDLRRAREKQEERRLLYVAATRAREELHLFARLSSKTAKDGSLALVEPRESLLKAAWPAWESEIRRRFEEWVALAASAAQPSNIASLAAAAGDNLIGIAPSAPGPTLLRRLPPGFNIHAAEPDSTTGDEALVGSSRLYERHEGGLHSRALGKAVHALLQQLAQLLTTQTHESALANLSLQKPRIAANVRAVGIETAAANRIAGQALQIVLRTADDPLAGWILAPHTNAANEVRWTGVVAGSLRTVQVDRIFRAGPAPQNADASASQANGASTNLDTWWIIDYKTAHEDGLDAASALPELRRQFAPQIEAYAAVLRNLHGAGVRLCGGLYYPRMALLDWWEL